MENTAASFLYGVQFSFINSRHIPKLPLLKAFLAALESIDRAASAVFGIDIQHDRILEDIEPRYFHYKISTILDFSGRLGGYPPSELLLSWMDRVRREMLAASRIPATEDNARAIALRWDTGIKEMGIHDGFIYNPPGSGHILILLSALRRSLTALGKDVSVELK